MKYGLLTKYWMFFLCDRKHKEKSLISVIGIHLAGFRFFDVSVFAFMAKYKQKSLGWEKKHYFCAGIEFVIQLISYSINHNCFIW